MPRFAMFNARSEVVDDDKTALRTFYVWCQSVWKSLNSPSATISNPTGGSTVDTEARQAISDILTALKSHGIIEE